MNKGLIGKKLGMTQIFDEQGKVIPVTVIEAGPCVVAQVKTVETDGYNAIQLGFGDVKESKINKPEKGHFAKSKLTPKKHLREFRLDSVENINVGDELKADTFTAGDQLDIQGTSKGKGFQGVIKRHGQSRGPMGHGSMYHRRPGSMGPTSTPGRVFKGKKLPGHMGRVTVTIQNLDVVTVILKQIGLDIAREQLDDAVEELLGSGSSAAESISAAYGTTKPSTATLAYSHLLQLWKGLNPYKLNVMVASSASVNDILSLNEMRDACAGLDFQGTGNIVTPMGAKLIVSEKVGANKILGIDKDFALQLVQSGDILVDFDKVIDKQLERAGITMITGFSRLTAKAAKVLDYGVTA